MKSLYVRIYLTVVVALALFAAGSAWLFQREVQVERGRFDAQVNERVGAWAELIQRSLPPADAPREEQAQALREWAQRLRLPGRSAAKPEPQPTAHPRACAAAERAAGSDRAAAALRWVRRQLSLVVQALAVQALVRFAALKPAAGADWPAVHSAAARPIALRRSLRRWAA